MESKEKMNFTDANMDEIVTGYQGKKYTLRELARTANEYTVENSAKKGAKIEGEKRYNSDSPMLPDEIWKEIDYTGWSKYQVSNKGRVKWNGQLIKQDDEIKDGRECTGYLVLDRKRECACDHKTYVYVLVAMAFLGKKSGDGLHVHHINNNGYDCRPENLILLEPHQHSKVHGFQVSTDTDSVGE